MYYVQDAHSFWDWMYFVALIVVSLSFDYMILVDIYTVMPAKYMQRRILRENY